MSMVWGTVTDTSPLRVTLDGDTTELPFTPDSLVDPLVFAVNDRVRCDLAGRRLVIVGRAGGSTVTPPNASTTVAGLVELATNAETITGTDASRAVTPAALAAVRALPAQGQVPSSVVVGSGSASVASDGTVTITSVSSVSLNGVFDTLGANLFLATFDLVTSAASAFGIRLRLAGSDAATSYDSQRFTTINTTNAAEQTLNAANWVGTGGVGIAGARHVGSMLFTRPGLAVGTVAHLENAITPNPMTTAAAYYRGSPLLHRPNTAYDGVSIIANSGTMTGTIKVGKIA